MQVKNARAWAPNTSKVYWFALLGTLAAFFMRYEFHPILQSQLPVLFFLFNTTVIVYKFGWRPATLSALIGMPLAYYYFIPPFNSFELPTTVDALNVLIFSALFILIIYFIEKLQRERFRAELISRVSDSRMQMMARLSSKK